MNEQRQSEVLRRQLKKKAFNEVIPKVLNTDLAFWKLFLNAHGILDGKGAQWLS